MILRHWRLILLLLLAAAGAAGGLILTRAEPPPLPDRAAGQRPVLLLLTSLPLLFADDFTLQQSGSPALAALERRYRVEPIDVASPSSLEGKRLLLMAHPLAQPAEALVALDRWVRSGGRLLLLADPELSWPSERPLGDLLRPPPAFADTGLLARWGLELHPPDGPGTVDRRLAGRRVKATSAGRLSGNCAIADDGFVASCAVGRGRVMVVADADFINPLAESGDGQFESLLAALDGLKR